MQAKGRSSEALKHHAWVPSPSITFKIKFDLNLNVIRFAGRIITPESRILPVYSMPEYKLANVVQVLVGTTDKSVARGVPLLFPTDVDEFGRLVSGPRRFAPQTPTAEKACVEAGDVLLPSKGFRLLATLVSVVLCYCDALANCPHRNLPPTARRRLLRNAKPMGPRQCPSARANGVLSDNFRTRKIRPRTLARYIRILAKRNT